MEFRRDRLTWTAYTLLAWFAYLQAARERHGVAAWDAVMRAGASLNFADAITFALEESPG